MTSSDLDNQSIESLRSLARRLAVATANKKINWDELDRTQGYAYTVDNASVVIATVDDDGNQPYELLLLNGAGDVIDQLVSHNKYGNRLYGEPWADELQKLHTVVRRVVLRVDETVNLLVANLPDDPGPEPVQQQQPATSADDEPPF